MDNEKKIIALNFLGVKFNLQGETLEVFGEEPTEEEYQIAYDEAINQPLPKTETAILKERLQTTEDALLGLMDFIMMGGM